MLALEANPLSDECQSLYRVDVTSVTKSSICKASFWTYAAVVGYLSLHATVHNVQTKQKWSMGDWLINYHGGFVRRGLAGQGLLAISDCFHLNPYFAVAIAQLALVAGIWWGIWRSVRRSTWPAWTCAALLSPATLAFSVWNPGNGFRKEELLILSLILVLATDRRVPSWCIGLMTSVLAGLCLLSHEGMVCYLPYWFAALVLTGRTLKSSLLASLAPATVALLCCCATATHPGDQKIVEAVCGGIGYSDVRPLPEACNGAISYLSTNTAQAHALVLEKAHIHNFFWIFPAVISLALLPLIVGGISLWKEPSNRCGVKVTVGAALTAGWASLSLFYYAIDWDRWISIHVLCLLILLLKIQSSGSEENIRESRLSQHPIVLTIMLFTYAVSWRDSYSQPCAYLYQRIAVHAKAFDESRSKTPRSSFVTFGGHRG